MTSQIPFKPTIFRPFSIRVIFVALLFMSFLLAPGNHKMDGQEIPASDFTIEWKCDLENVKKNMDPMADSDHITHATEEDIFLCSRPVVLLSHFKEPSSQQRHEIIIPPPELVS